MKNDVCAVLKSDSCGWLKSDVCGCLKKDVCGCLKEDVCGCLKKDAWEELEENQRSKSTRGLILCREWRHGPPCYELQHCKKAKWLSHDPTPLNTFICNTTKGQLTNHGILGYPQHSLSDLQSPHRGILARVSPRFSCLGNKLLDTLSKMWWRGWSLHGKMFRISVSPLLAGTETPQPPCHLGID